MSDFMPRDPNSPISKTDCCIPDIDNQTKLKPCPFCGKKAIFKCDANSSNHIGVGFKFEVKCGHCEVKLNRIFKIQASFTPEGQIDIWNDERQEAIEAWNRRSIITEPDKFDG